jgi:hypothetical protein
VDLKTFKLKKEVIDMLEKIKEMNRKMCEKIDERNVKDWKKHPILNKWAILLLGGFMIVGATTAIILSLFGYITQEMSVPITVVLIGCCVLMYGEAMWILKYGKKIAKKASPN